MEMLEASKHANNDVSTRLTRHEIMASDDYDKHKETAQNYIILKYQNNERQVKTTNRRISETKMVQSSKTSCAIHHKIPQMSTRFGNLVNFSLDRKTLNSIFQSKSKPMF